MAVGCRYGSGKLGQSFAEFVTTLHAQGFDEVIERRWPPMAVAETHVHPFMARALLVQGEMWLTAGDETAHLMPGSTFEIDALVPHAERYGRDGATYWVGRRQGSVE